MAADAKTADPKERVRAQIAALDPVDERERVSIESALAALARLPRPFDEHADPTHVTASAIVIGARGVLLHRHKRLGIWMQPGGHVDVDEAPELAAVREVAEETGLTVHHAGEPVIVHVDVHDAAKGHVHLDLRYLLTGDDRDPAPPEGESPDVAWFDWDAALAAADPGLAGGLRKVRGKPGVAKL